MSKMPDNAKFPVPPVDHGSWNDQDWYNYWQSTGGRLDPKPHYENPDPMPPISYKDGSAFVQEVADRFKKTLDK